MDHPTAVRICERIDDVVEHPNDVRDAESAVALDGDAKRLALDVRHRVVQDAIPFAGGEQGYDVRMMQLRGELDLPAEALDVDAGREVGGQHLDDHLTAECTLGRHEDAT